MVLDFLEEVSLSASNVAGHHALKVRHVIVESPEESDIGDSQEKEFLFANNLNYGGTVRGKTVSVNKDGSVRMFFWS